MTFANYAAHAVTVAIVLVALVAGGGALVLWVERCRDRARRNAAARVRQQAQVDRRLHLVVGGRRG